MIVVIIVVIIERLVTKYVDPSQHVGFVERCRHLNPLTAKLFNLNFHPLEIVSR